MKRKVLFVATVLRGHVLVFHLPYMKWFQEQGYEVHLCCRNDTPDPEVTVPYCDRFIELPFERSPLNKANLGVYKQLKALIDQENYALIHCNTPVGGMLGRLCARAARKKGTKVVYTAHGFHFFSGAPLKNWLLFYPAERFLSRWTDRSPGRAQRAGAEGRYAHRDLRGRAQRAQESRNRAAHRRPAAGRACAVLRRGREGRGARRAGA